MVTTYPPPKTPAELNLLLKRMVVFQVRLTYGSLPSAEGERESRMTFYLRAKPTGEIYSEGVASDVGCDTLGVSETTSARILADYLFAEVTTSSRGESYRAIAYELWPAGHIDLFDTYRAPSAAELARVDEVADFDLSSLLPVATGGAVVGTTSVQADAEGYVSYPGTNYIYGKRVGLSVEPLSAAESVKLAAAGKKLFHVEVLRRPASSPPPRDRFLQIKRDVALHLR